MFSFPPRKYVSGHYHTTQSIIFQGIAGKNREFAAPGRVKGYRRDGSTGTLPKTTHQKMMNVSGRGGQKMD
jgi:hypothetical protein